jgi:hypothetical protein
MGICVGLVTCEPAAPSLVLDGDPFFPRGCFHGFFINIVFKSFVLKSGI